MQFILDNLIAVLVAGVLLLTLQVTQVRSQHADIEQVASHSVKTKTLIFGHWVEQDILGIGANFGTNTYRFEEPDTSAIGNTTRWVFFSDSTRDDGTSLRVFKRYRLLETEVVEFQTDTVQMYQVRRDSVALDFGSGGTAPTVASIPESSWTRDTRSIGTLSFFRVDLLDRQGETPRYTDGAMDGEIDPNKADYIRVRFGVVPEYVLKPDNYIRELYWSKTLKVRPYWVPPPSLDAI